MGEEGNDEDQRQGRVEVGIVEPGPAREAAAQEVGPVILHPLPAQKMCNAHPSGNEEDPEGRHGEPRVGIEEGDNHQADGVVGNGEQQQVGDDRVVSSEDQPRGQPGEGDVGSGRDSPAIQESGRTDQTVHQQVDSNRSDYPAGCREKRVYRLTERVQVAAGKAALGYLRCGDGEEKNHEDIVGDEVKAQRPPEMAVVELPVAFRRQVGPAQRSQDPGKEGDGEFA